MVASGTPCEKSETGSFSGKRAARMRRRRSSSSAWDAWYVKGRIASDLVVPSASLLGLMDGWDVRRPLRPNVWDGTRRGCKNAASGLLTGNL